MNGRIRIKIASSVAALAIAAGCMQSGDAVTRGPMGLFGFGQGNDAVPAVSAQPALEPTMQNGEQSQIITGLLQRRSAVSAGPFSDVSRAVLAANSRAAEADLRAAKLRAEARASNWLPSLGPSISLSSLGDIVTSLVVEQVLFDNGRKKAERDYAAADVEVAAVVLAQDTNERVLSALELYLNAQSANARAQVNADAMERMTHFEYVMSERVRGGVSNRVDLQIVQQKRNQMQADMASDQEAAAAAMAELGAMSAQSLAGVAGLSPIAAPDAGVEPLSVMKARAESSRAIAEARASRAGFLPGVTAGGDIANGGGVGLTVGAPNGIGFGTGASLEALAATEAASAARVGQVSEDANRRLRALEGELASLIRQEAQAQTLAAQAAANYDVFAEQQRAGQRAVPEVVGIFETKVRTAREAATLKYDVARMRLRIAAHMGSLVDGASI